MNLSRSFVSSKLENVAPCVSSSELNPWTKKRSRRQTQTHPLLLHPLLHHPLWASITLSSSVFCSGKHKPRSGASETSRITTTHLMLMGLACASGKSQRLTVKDGTCLTCKPSHSVTTTAKCDPKTLKVGCSAVVGKGLRRAVGLDDD